MCVEMIEAQPSRTALRVALRRAAHQLHDARPLVFDDPLAVRILGPEYTQELARTPDKERRPFSAALRAFMVARARLAEDVLAEAYAERGVRQYLVLGAGLDTFAYRNPHTATCGCLRWTIRRRRRGSGNCWRLRRFLCRGVCGSLRWILRSSRWRGSWRRRGLI